MMEVNHNYIFSLDCHVVLVGDGEWWFQISARFIEGDEFEREIDLTYKLWIRSGNILWLWGNVFWGYECCELDNKWDYFRIFDLWIYGKW